MQERNDNTIRSLELESALLAASIRAVPVPLISLFPKHEQMHDFDLRELILRAQLPFVRSSSKYFEGQIEADHFSKG
jgi:hypothetical protein